MRDMAQEVTSTPSSPLIFPLCDVVYFYHELHALIRLWGISHSTLACHSSKLADKNFGMLIIYRNPIPTSPHIRTPPNLLCCRLALLAPGPLLEWFMSVSSNKQSVSSSSRAAKLPPLLLLLLSPHSSRLTLPSELPRWVFMPVRLAPSRKTSSSSVPDGTDLILVFTSSFTFTFDLW